MEKEGAKCIKIKGLDDKRQITAVFGGTLTGEFLPIQYSLYTRVVLLGVILISNFPMTGI